MKSLTHLLWLLPLCAACDDNDSATPQAAPQFSSTEEAHAYFDDLDAQQMRAMVGRDSAFFARHYADTYYNCTPYGELNNKAAKIQPLLKGPWVTVERHAPSSTSSPMPAT